MGLYKIYPDKFDRTRNRCWHRMRAQALFRSEPWDIDFPTFCEFWPNEATWARRGRGSDDLCMTRIDPRASWSAANCVLITRSDHLKLKSARFHGQDTRPFLKKALKR